MVSDYQIGAFEALEWAWHMLRNYKEQPRGLEDARSLIRETLLNMGKGDKMDFADKLREVTPAN